MKLASCGVLLLGAVLAGAAVAGTESVKWNMFDRRLGMFVHWGIYSAGGLHEQEQMRYRRTREEYNRRMAEFAAEKFTGDNLVDVAESAGAEYIVVTAKHHDGFCMWDTATTDFNAVNSAARRDLIGELAAACRRRGMKLGFYFSNPDWHQPFAHNAASTHQIGLQPGDVPDMEKYVALVRAQVTELLTKYGEIVCFFWDIPTHVDLPGMDELVRRLQPGIMINDRGWGNKATCDYSTPERDYAWELGNRHIEACDAVGVHSWGYRVNEDYRTTGYLTRNIDRYLSSGGNFLLNVGPKADGTVPEEAARCMREVGRWYAKVRESYRSVTTETNLVGDAGFTVTRRGSDVYLHFREAPASSGVFLPDFGRVPREAVVLNTGTPLKAVVELDPWSWKKEGSRLALHLMGIPADELANEAVVIRLSFGSEETRVGIIGCDTSHAIAFTKLMNVERKDFAEGFRVTAAYQWGSRDIVSSTNRYATYLPQLREMGVEIVPSIAELLAKCDVVCLETNDGREHLRQALEVFRSGKRVFIDKPIAHDYADAKRIYEAGRASGATYFSSSALRYADAQQDCRAGKFGKVVGCEYFAPSPPEEQGTHSRYTWYGIHGFEAVMTVMGPGVRSVRTVAADGADVIVMKWADGRTATLRAAMASWSYGGFAHLEKGKPVALGGYEGYEKLLRRILAFFRTGEVPVPAEETLELFAVMEAAAKSRAEDGREVGLSEITGAATR